MPIYVQIANIIKANISVRLNWLIPVLYLYFLVPGPKILSRLQSCEVVEGQDARFSIELSAPMVGTWFLNSAQLQHGGRYSIQHNQTKHSVVIHESRMTEDEAEVTFIANGVRDSAVLNVKRRCKNLWKTCDWCIFFKFA